MSENSNISSYLKESALKYPQKKALFFRDESISFRQLDLLSDYYSFELRNAGIHKNDRVLMMLKPGIEFVAAVFAVFKNGSLPVLIDPGMGRDNMLNCIKTTAPDAMIGIPLANWLKYLFWKSFKSVKKSFSINGKVPGCIKLKTALEFQETDLKEEFPIEHCLSSEPAAVVFTTGSTGPPKGVLYTHGIYITQMRLIADVYGAGPDMFDMPAFPLFSLFSAAMGMPCVIPDINPSLPAHVDPEVIIDTIKKHQVSFSFASPALWLRVAEYCKNNSVKLDSLQRILMAGAPVSPYLHKLLKICAPNAETLVPYGATEALPAANFSGSEMTDALVKRIKSGEGYCVGRSLPGIKIRIMKPVNGPVENWNDDLMLNGGETGEIVIEGDIVTPQYYNLPEHTLNAKIKKNGKILHRMGDMGYFDSDGYLWFKGRKAHRVFSDNQIFYPVCSEAIFNQHPKVFRSALVGIGPEDNELPVIIIEPFEDILPLSTEDRNVFIQELKDLAELYPHTKGIENFLFYTPFPVDIRHNAKIFREKLKIWAQSFYPVFKKNS